MKRISSSMFLALVAATGCGFAPRAPDRQSALIAATKCLVVNDNDFEKFSQDYAVNDRGKTWIVFLKEYARPGDHGIEPWGGPAAEVNKATGICEGMQLN
jgi:hypothetical protein